MCYLFCMFITHINHTTININCTFIVLHFYYIQNHDFKLKKNVNFLFICVDKQNKIRIILTMEAKMLSAT